MGVTSLMNYPLSIYSQRIKWPTPVSKRTTLLDVLYTEQFTLQWFSLFNLLNSPVNKRILSYCPGQENKL